MSDLIKLDNSYYDLGLDFFKPQHPNHIDKPKLVLFNNDLAKNFNLGNKISDADLANIFCGNILLPNSKPIALAYAGHQFGNFVPQLGDGRAVLLGEIKNKKNQIYDIALKGSGQTYFSRSGDGKYPLNAAIKEYIFSEALHYLKIPAARSLALVATNEFVNRSDVNQGSVITRIAKSHIRIGTFEYFAAKNDFNNVKKIADYSIKRHFPQCLEVQNIYLSLLKKVIKSQAELVSSWMSVGFIHGVMNTDNIAICKDTIDFGPCAFMDEYHQNKTFSYIDKRGRYSYSNQRNIILWNLTRFAETILPLIDVDIKKAVKLAEAELNKFENIFDKIYYSKMMSKIGIFNFEKGDEILIKEFLEILQSNQLDFTNSFRNLSEILVNNKIDDKNHDLKIWRKKWLGRLSQQNLGSEKIAIKMNKINPILIPRNHLVEKIINKSINDNSFCELKEFVKALKKPFIYNEYFKEYYRMPTQEEQVHHTFCGT